MEGTCKYCGQIITTTADNQKDADRIATLTCSCDEAKIAARREHSVTEAKDLIDELFPENEDERNETLAIAIKRVIDEIGSGRFRSVSMQINGKVSVSVGLTGKGTIKVSRVDKTKQAYETVE